MVAREARTLVCLRPRLDLERVSVYLCRTHGLNGSAAQPRDHYSHCCATYMTTTSTPVVGCPALLSALTGKQVLRPFDCVDG